LATTKLGAAASEITRLSTENQRLRERDASHASENLYLKLRLNALEDRAKTSLSHDDHLELVGDIEALGKSARQGAENWQRVAMDTLQESIELVNELSESLDATEGSTEDDAVPLDAGPEKQTAEATGQQKDAQTGVSKQNGSPQPGKASRTVDAGEIETEEIVPKEERSRKTAWQMLWDDLADFAGIHDEYREF